MNFPGISKFGLDVRLRKTITQRMQAVRMSQSDDLITQHHASSEKFPNMRDLRHPCRFPEFVAGIGTD